MAAKGTSHLHGCIHCHDTYEDNCATRTVNGRCNPCIRGQPSMHALGRRPIECCRTYTRLAHKHEIKTYRLAGEHPWYLCGRCHRTFTYDPRAGGSP